jgi:membrane protein DedA with SNARE-associated domain
MFPNISIESVIAILGYSGIFLLMIANGVVSFPSSQVLYIIVGYFVGTGALLFLPALVIGALGNVIGNIFLYELVRAKGVRVVRTMLGLPLREKTLTDLERVFKKRGLIFLFIGKLIPAVKVFVPIVGGISRTPRFLFSVLMFASSLIWAFAFISIGFIFGKGSNVFGAGAVIVILIAIIFSIFFVWFLKKEGIKLTE